MNARTLLLLLLLMAGALGGAAAAQAQPSGAYAFVDVQVVDVERGRVLPDQTVTIADGRIQHVGTTGTIPLAAGMQVIEASGKYLIPGLWDMHVHALWDAAVAGLFLNHFLAHGVTGIRDMGGTLDVLRMVRQDSTRLRPRIQATGLILDGPEPVSPEVSLAISTPDEARAAVEMLVEAGVDALKVYTLLPADAYAAVLEAGRRHGLPVVGHVPAAVTPGEAAAEGQRSIEHLRDELEPYCTPETVDRCGALIADFTVHETWQTPTLTILRAKVMLDDPAFAEDPRLQTLPALVRAEWAAIRQKRLAERTASEWAAKRARYKGEQWLTGYLHGAGVPLLAGTDAGVLYTFPGSSLHDELALLVEAGLSPWAALRTATWNPAVYMQATALLGSIAPGKYADLVLLHANPLVDIQHTRAIDMVVQGGRLLRREDLDALLRSN